MFAAAAQLSGRHLPPPHLDEQGNAIVPKLTAKVLTMFESDDRVFRQFCAGVHSLEVVTGSMAKRKEKDAQLAEQFI